MRRLVPLFAFVVAVLGACGVDDDPPVLATRPIVARFAPDEAGDGATPAFLDVPFPSDVYRKDGRFGAVPGLERVFKRGAPFLASQLAKVSGWSRVAPVAFVIDDVSQPPNEETGAPAQAVLDRGSLPADEEACRADASSVFLVDLEADPGAARVPCRAVFFDTPAENDPMLLTVGPARGVVLEEGHRYAAVVTSRVRDPFGRNVIPSEGFVATIDRREGPLADLYGAAYDKVMAVIGGALAADGARVVSLAPYTTQTISSEIYAVRDALEAAPPAALKWDAASLAPMGAVKFAQKQAGVLPAGFTASLDDWLGVVAPAAKLPDGSDDPDDTLPVRAHDAIAAFGTAVFEATNWLQVKPGTYDDVDHATFARDGAGNPIPAREKPTSKIWMSIAVPTAPMPPGGYPAVVVQHGLGSSRAYLLALANRICKKGWIAIAIDSITFGARANDPKFLVDATHDWASAPGVTYTGPDGISDRVGAEPAQRAGSFDLFGGLKNLLALRDQLRQAALDTSQVVKLLRADPDLAPLATAGVSPKVDPDKIAYVGDSLGAIEGALAAAIEPRVKAWTLNVGGGGVLTELAAHGPAINAQLALAGALNFGFIRGQYSEDHPVVLLGQTLLEGGDPIAYASHIVRAPKPLAGAPTRPRNVFQIEVLYDEVVANEANEALARAGGWAMATPNVGLNAGVADVTGRVPYRGGGIVLPFVDPDASGFHDTPTPGVTALLAQVSPAQHGADLVRSKGSRTYPIPYNSKEGHLGDLDRTSSADVPCPYRELQDAMLRFFGDAFEGKVPVLTGLPAPQRDLDGDGALDDADPAPLDPQRK